MWKGSQECGRWGEGFGGWMRMLVCEGARRGAAHFPGGKVEGRYGRWSCGRWKSGSGIVARVGSVDIRVEKWT